MSSHLCLQRQEFSSCTAQYSAESGEIAKRRHKPGSAQHCSAQHCSALRLNDSRAQGGFGIWLRLYAWLFLIPVLCGGCHRDHSQSMLQPAGPAAAEIAWLSWFLIAICSIIFFAVMVLLAVAVLKRPARTPVADADADADVPGNSQPLGQRFVLITGLVLPSIVLIAILLLSLKTQVALKIPDTTENIRVVGHMWWWEVHYPDHGIIIANEIRLPVGEPIRIELESVDVIHSLWVPSLQGKMDLIPGKTNTLWLQADRPGDYRGVCAEYCGVQHAKMGLVVVAQSRDEYDQWLAERQEPPLEISGQAERGREVFFESTCHNCHAIAGTDAIASRGPNLTHVGNRKTLGAGILPNNSENMKDWISQPQVLKPGSLMPKTDVSPKDLLDLVKYLESLQ